MSSFGSPSLGVDSKPLVIHDYNLGMRGVDLADQKSLGRIVARKRMKRWYVKVFYHFLILR